MSKEKSDDTESFLANLIKKISIAYKYDSSLKHQVLVSTLPSRMKDNDFDNTIKVIGESADIKGTSESQKQNLTKVQKALSEIREYNKAHPEGEKYTAMVLKKSILENQVKGGRNF